MINSISVSTQADSITFETKVLNIRDQIIEETTQKASNIMKKNLAERKNPDKTRFLAHNAFVRFKEKVTKEFPEASYKNKVYLAILSQQRFFCCKLREQLYELMVPKIESPSQLTEQIIEVETPKFDPEERELIKLELDDWMRNSEAKGSTEEAARRILEAFDTNAEKLTLERLDLALLPIKVISLLPKLSWLNLSRNSLTSFSAESSSFPKLSWLNLSRNSLTSFSAESGSFPNLKHLSLSSNNFINFFSKRDSFPNLEQLNLDNNALTSFTIEKGSFPNLKTLYLSYNFFATFLGESDFFPNLEALYLDNNSLTSFSNGSDSFSRLTKLDLGENSLTELSPGLAHLMRLCELNTKNNPLSEQANTAFQSAIDKNRRENKQLGPEWRTTTVDQEKHVALLELIKLLKSWIHHPKAKGLTEEAAKRILEAFDTNAEKLTLKDLRITFLPSRILDLLPRLSRLDLSNNQIMAKSSELADLSNHCSLLAKNNLLFKQIDISEEKYSTLRLHINEIILKVADAKSPLASSEILKKSSQENELS